MVASHHNPELDKNLDCEAFIVDAVRTPIGRYGGALKDVRPDDLAAQCIDALMQRTGMNPNRLQDIVLGCANQSGEDSGNVARMAGLLAGVNITTGGVTINRLSGSGLDAINYAAAMIRSGMNYSFIAGGVENMTRAPYVMAKSGAEFERGTRELFDTSTGWRFTNPALSERFHPYTLGETAENVAEKWGISREEQDAYALESQRKAKEATEGNCFSEEMTPIRVGRHNVSADEQPRHDATPESLAKVKPYRQQGTVTPANSSVIGDGAAVLLVLAGSELRELEYRPLARVVSWAIAGVDPSYMGIGPVPATRKALKLAGLEVSDLDLIELDEGSAAQAIVCIRELGLDVAKVNVNGGSIALGNPTGASGARSMTTLIHELRRRGACYGLATMSIGAGQGIATIIECL